MTVENKDWSAANDNINNCKAIWQKLKLQLNNKYKNDIDQFDNLINNLVTYISKKDATATTKEANSLLEAVDTLEKDFSNQKK